MPRDTFFDNSATVTIKKETPLMDGAKAFVGFLALSLLAVLLLYAVATNGVVGSANIDAITSPAQIN